MTPKDLSTSCVHGLMITKVALCAAFGLVGCRSPVPSAVSMPNAVQDVPIDAHPVAEMKAVSFRAAALDAGHLVAVFGTELFQLEAWCWRRVEVPRGRPFDVRDDGQVLRVFSVDGRVVAEWEVQSDGRLQWVRDVAIPLGFKALFALESESLGVVVASDSELLTVREGVAHSIRLAHPPVGLWNASRDSVAVAWSDRAGVWINARGELTELSEVPRSRWIFGDHGGVAQLRDRGGMRRWSPDSAQGTATERSYMLADEEARDVHASLASGAWLNDCCPMLFFGQTAAVFRTSRRQVRIVATEQGEGMFVDPIGPGFVVFEMPALHPTHLVLSVGNGIVVDLEGRVFFLPESPSLVVESRTKPFETSAGTTCPKVPSDS